MPGDQGRPQRFDSRVTKSKSMAGWSPRGRLDSPGLSKGKPFKREAGVPLSKGWYGRCRDGEGSIQTSGVFIGAFMPVEAGRLFSWSFQ